MMPFPPAACSACSAGLADLACSTACTVEVVTPLTLLQISKIAVRSMDFSLVCTSFAQAPDRNMSAGAKSAKPLLDSQVPWHEASAALPKLQVPQDHQPDEAQVEAKSRVAEQLMETEAAAFEKQLGKRNPADAQWLQSVSSAVKQADCTQQR